MKISDFRAYWLGVLTTLPAWLGGDLVTWKLGLFAIVLAVFGFIYPPQFNLSRPLKWAVVMLLCWPLVGFFPRIISSSWHETLIASGLDVGWVWSPQPWILLNAWLVVLVGGFWFLCLFGRKMDVSEMRKLLQAFTGSIVLLAVVALFQSLGEHRLLWWEPLHGIGPFPNRNQSGNLFALSGFMVMALAAYESNNKRQLFIALAVSSMVLFLATVINGSRTGISLFLVGALVWAIWQFKRHQKKSHAVVLFSVAILFLTLFLILGGEALERLSATFTGIKSGEQVLSGRVEIWKDTFQMALTSPLHGVGIGNYSELFALFREKLISEHRVIHPDSDYFWWLAEIGVIGLGLLGWALFLTFKPFFNDQKRPGKRLRIAAMITSVLFLGHALVDVSGHRLGTLVPAMLWLRLTWPPTKSGYDTIEIVSLKVLWPVIIVSLVGVWFILPQVTSIPIPNTTYVEKVKAGWQESFAESPERAMTEVRRAAQIAPLDWQIHYCMGLGLLLAEKNPEEAWRHYGLARLLEPSVSDLPYREGLVWMNSDVSKTWYVWREALKRRNLDRSGLLNTMLEQSRERPELEELLLFLAARVPDLRHHVLTQLTEVEFKQERDKYLTELSHEIAVERKVMKIVFRNWAKREGSIEVASYLAQNPEWATTGWRHLMRAKMEAGAHQEAYEAVHKLFPAPVYPKQITSKATRNEHMRRVLNGSADLVSIYSFLRFDADQISFNTGKEVVDQTLKKVSAPSYLKYMAAEYYASHEDWKMALTYLERYGDTLKDF